MKMVMATATRAARLHIISDTGPLLLGTKD
jgi:hypothetical protein